jgi:hypothetical protein
MGANSDTIALTAQLRAPLPPIDIRSRVKAERDERCG